MQKLRVYGLRLTEGTTVRAKLEESGLEEKLLSLVFTKNGCREREILFLDNINLALLPRATVSLRTLSRAVKNDSRVMSLFNLGTLIFETKIEMDAKVVIQRGTHTRSGKKMVQFSIKAGRYLSSAACRFTELKNFIEQRNGDADPERDGEEQ
jgi:hypothetical protein